MESEIMEPAGATEQDAPKVLTRTEPCSAELARLCAEVVDDVTLVLQRQGVEEFWPVIGIAFDRQEQRAVATRTIDEASLDGTVAHTRRPGYRMEDRVVRFAEVEVQRRTTG